ncbi:MAG: DEAD/DEAH box helicase family protein [Deltaproteobacteria bacterium]|nr:DEAD/DEAH box helicase family protein [Deltaproteobacteria bacterium]
MDNSEYFEKQLNEALNECARLKAENDRLRQMLGQIPEEETSTPKNILAEPSFSFAPNKVTNGSPSKEKIVLFRSLFRGRGDVYPLRWERKDGRSGYSPACALEWKRPFCGKPQVKCGECENRKLLPVTDEVVHNHLTGKATIGVYPLAADETCWFLAADFDKKTWQEDAAAFLETCRRLGIPAALERSRSGKGGHVWIFFDRPISAALVRKLGCAVLTRTLEGRYQLGLESYDRFFPSQDTLPKGGFGNLIALPLQWGPREEGNSLFLDEHFIPYPDQWRYLSSLQRVSLPEVESRVREAFRSGTIINIRLSPVEAPPEDDPWVSPSRTPKKKIVSGHLPETVQLVLSNQIYIEKDGLPSELIGIFVRLAAFQNPEFYRTQALRLPTFNKPRIISCSDDFPRHLGLPRGCLEEVLDVLRENQIAVQLKDERYHGDPVDVHFRGRLRPYQIGMVEAVLAADLGVLSAPTASGKTVMAAWIVAARKVNTLVLVHRRQLLDQWRDRLATFLDLPLQEIGQIGGGKDSRTGRIDVGIIQSLVRKGAVKDLVSVYGQVIVDECHHLPAFSFEQVLKKAKAKFVLGLTATPIRKDGHHPIILMQCGPLRFKDRARRTADSLPFEHVVFERETRFKLPGNFQDPGIQDIYQAMALDEERNELIFNDILSALEEKRSPLVLTERKEHLEHLQGRLKNFARNIIVLQGGLGKKQRLKISEQLKTIPDGEERLILATGRYIGEGFDDARLDTLFLVMPISWRGTLQQYVGRLHRLHDNKRVVQVYDYVDKKVPMLMRMYNKRLVGYHVLGYRIKDISGSKS